VSPGLDYAYVRDGNINNSGSSVSEASKMLRSRPNRPKICFRYLRGEKCGLKEAVREHLTESLAKYQ